jgi:hypothetical protein
VTGASVACVVVTCRRRPEVSNLGARSDLGEFLRTPLESLSAQLRKRLREPHARAAPMRLLRQGSPVGRVGENALVDSAVAGTSKPNVKPARSGCGLSLHASLATRKSASWMDPLAGQQPVDHFGPGRRAAHAFSRRGRYPLSGQGIRLVWRGR